MMIFQDNKFFFLLSAQEPGTLLFIVEKILAFPFFSFSTFHVVPRYLAGVFVLAPFPVPVPHHGSSAPPQTVRVWVIKRGF